MIFATPYFGTGGLVLLILYGISLTILGIGIASIAWRIALRRSPTTSRKLTGSLLVMASLLLPISCCSGPSILFRLNHDTPPLSGIPRDVIKVGMTQDEVRAKLGNPHEIKNHDPQQVVWFYWQDAVGFEWFVVIFGPDGRLEHTAH